MNISIHIMVGDRRAEDDGEVTWSFDTSIGRCLVSYTEDHAGATKEALAQVKAELERIMKSRGAA